MGGNDEGVVDMNGESPAVGMDAADPEGMAVGA